MWTIIISNLISGFIPFSIFVWSIFMTHAGGYTYLGLYVLFTAYLFIIDSIKPKPDPLVWTSEEIDVLREYHIALRSPFGAKDMSCHLNKFRIIGLFLLAPWTLWNHMWIVGAILVLFFFISSPISVRLDPFFFLGDAVAKGKTQFANELAILQQVSEKLKEKTFKEQHPDDTTNKTPDT